MRNTAAIDKILKEIAERDFKGQEKRMARQRFGHRSFIPSLEWNRCHDVKEDYINGDISEEQYKAFCLRYNLSHR